MMLAEPIIVTKYLEYLKENIHYERKDGYDVAIMPYTYPDNTPVEVFIKERADSRLVLSDRGLALFQVAVMTGSSIEESQKGNIELIANKRGLILEGDELLALTSYPESGDALMRMCLAIREIGDLAYTVRARKEDAFKQKIGSLLERRGIPYRRGYEFDGKNGVRCRVDFLVETGPGKLVKTLYDNRSAATDAYMTFDQLQEAGDDRRRIVVAEGHLSARNRAIASAKADAVLTLSQADELLASLV